MNESVIIIGAGIGGICSAIRLAKAGLRVTIVEKNARPGGRCDRITRDGHHFDTGPTLLVMPLLYEQEFRGLGVEMRDVVDLQRVDPTYHLVFDDGSRLNLTSDMKRMYDQLEGIERGAFDGLLRYMDEGYRHYQLGTEKLVYRDFRSFSDFFNFENLPLIYQVKPLVNHHDNMATYFDSERLKAAFTFQDVYMGLSPFEAPATFSMMAYTELAHGVWYPRGGMYSLIEALVTMARAAGVTFVLETQVECIQTEGERVRGVVLEGGRALAADVVLANADLPYVYQNLLPPDEEAAKFDDMRFSCSTISFFWGIDKVYDQLAPHMLFLADDYRANFKSIIDDLALPANPSLYIHAPARLDPSMAPPGEDTIVAVVPVGHMSDDGQQDWATTRDLAREHVFRRLDTIGVSNLRDHIKFETSFSPLSWRKRYNLMKGSTHGLCHNLTQLAYFRPDNRHDRYHNLYFVGASTRPGTGMPTAMISARHVATRILEDLAEIERG